MTIQDPKTRHLTRNELSSVLSAMRDSTLHEDELKTTVMVPRSRKVPPSVIEPVTELELRPSDILAAPRAREELEDTARSRALPRGRNLTPTARIAGGICLAGAACWFALRSTHAEGAPVPMPTVASVAASSSAAPVPTAEPVSAESPAPRVAAPPSERGAVDLLVAGRMRDALDAYRALALHEPANLAFAAVVAQLQWELTSCQKEGAPCAR